MTKNRESAVRASLDRWLEAWRRVDVELMLSLFDGGHPGFIYQSEEAPVPLRDGVELRAFWENARELMPEGPDWVETRSDIEFDGSLAVVFTQIDAKILVKGVENPIAGPIRVSLILKEADSGWKIIHYHESRQADLAAFGLEDVPLYHPGEESEGTG